MGLNAGTAAAKVTTAAAAAEPLQLVNPSISQSSTRHKCGPVPTPLTDSEPFASATANNRRVLPAQAVDNRPSSNLPPPKPSPKSRTWGIAEENVFNVWCEPKDGWETVGLLYTAGDWEASFCFPLHGVCIAASEARRAEQVFVCTRAAPGAEVLTRVKNFFVSSESWRTRRRINWRYSDVCCSAETFEFCNIVKVTLAIRWLPYFDTKCVCAFQKGVQTFTPPVCNYKTWNYLSLTVLCRTTGSLVSCLTVIESDKQVSIEMHVLSRRHGLQVYVFFKQKNFSCSVPPSFDAELLKPYFYCSNLLTYYLAYWLEVVCTTF